MEESTDTEPSYTVMEYIQTRNSRCGYCKSSDSSSNKGMWAHKMTSEHYQLLVDRGWRRSGRFVYKPTMNQTCCPQYTIRCDAENLQLSKSQKKILKRMHRFLITGKKPGDSKNMEVVVEDKNGADHEPNCGESEMAMHQNAQPNLRLTDDTISANQAKTLSDLQKRIPSVNESSESQQISSTTSIEKKFDPTLPRCKKAKVLRLEKRLAKGSPIVKKSPNVGKSLEEFINEPLPANAAHKLELRLVPVESNLFRKTYLSSYGLFRLYQIAIHNDTEGDCDQDSYETFLVDSPIETWYPVNGPVHGYGSFHQQYWLDDRLIAVGVIDILPKCVSSVYLYYDPEFSFLSLGTYAALRELAFTRELCKVNPKLKWYYMGYYIHTCAKMRYKSHYTPSYLLCPEAYTWHPVEKCVGKLDTAKYVRFNEDPFAQDPDKTGDIGKTLCLYDSSPMYYETYLRIRRKRNAESEVKDYFSLVGRKAAYSILLYRE